MKTKTLLLAIISFSMVVSANNYQPDTETTVEISLAKAIKNPGLVQQMYIQLDDSIICNETTSFKYTVDVYYLNTHYIITGTYEEWVLFFLMDLVNYNGEILGT